MSGTTTTVETTQVTTPTSQHVSTSTIDNKSKEPSSSNKKPNKRHNKGKGKKKAPNALNATEAGTPSKSNEGENPKKPSNNSKNNSKKPKPANNKPVAARISKDRAQGRLTQGGDEAVPSTSSDVQKKKRPNNRQKKQSHELPPGNHDMSTILSHELKTSTYECMICMDTVKPANYIWTCDCCWAMFHLNCIQTWASRSLKDTSSNKMITAWRCPGCQNSQTAIPKDYLCFCGKQRNPEPSRYNTPHSCDQLCKRHKSCPHECVLPCHPGPCPPCTSMGPVLTCYCGQATRQQRCLDTDYSTKGFSCTDTCDELLGCGKHRCQQECHAGICPPCDIEEVQSCYCGRHERTARCGSGKQIQMRGHIGHYSCTEKCDAMFACGQHQCEKSCHPCTANAQPCPGDPTFVKTCPCGAHTIAELVGERTSCTDPIPTCESTCNKVSACGHPCSEKCHVGDCPPCQVKVQVACRCQSTSFEETCADVCEANGGEPPLCDRICRSIRNCGRHQCGQKCCPAMKVKGKRKSGTEYAHDCPQVCDQLLSCGIHRCQDRCHKGKCLPCLEATFEDVTCHCGRTRLEPPVRCGTKLPPCPHPCIRPNPCGHIRFLNHNCHPDDEPCPPCPTLVSRHCLCGKTELKNVPCYRESPRCGRVCEKQLSCGKHICLKTCHDGPCIAEDESCTQVCGGTRSKCGHICKEKCHEGECPQIEPCTARIKATCSCGQNSIEIPCNATEESNGSKRELECNDFCAKVMRNRRLAMALDIKRDDFSTPLSPALSASSSDRVLSYDDLGYYDDSLCEFYIENANWCRQMEVIMIEFVQDANKKSFHFKPMRSEQRRFLHRYAVHFNLATEAIDSEPKRSVIMRKTIGVCRVPPILLSKAARNPSLNRPPPAVEQEPVKFTLKQPVNALYLSDMAFGLTKLELDADLASLMKIDQDTIHFTSKWINENDAIVVPSISDAISMHEKEKIIWQLKKTIKTAFTSKEDSKAARVDCCWVNQKGEVTWNEKDLQKKETTAEPLVNKTRTVNAYDVLNTVDDDGWMKVGGNNPFRPTKDAWFESPKSGSVVESSGSKEDSENEQTTPDHVSSTVTIATTVDSTSTDSKENNEPEDWENLIEE